MKKQTLIGIVFLALVYLSVFSLLAYSGENYELKEIVVEPGDTIWTIAEKHCSPEENIRNFVFTIREVNEIDGAVIHPGQKLLVPDRN